MADTDPVQVRVPVKLTLAGEVTVYVRVNELDEPTREAIIKRAEELAIDEAEDGFILDEFDVSESEVYDEPEILDE